MVSTHKESENAGSSRSPPPHATASNSAKSGNVAIGILLPARTFHIVCVLSVCLEFIELMDLAIPRELPHT